MLYGDDWGVGVCVEKYAVVCACDVLVGGYVYEVASDAPCDIVVYARGVKVGNLAKQDCAVGRKLYEGDFALPHVEEMDGECVSARHEIVARAEVEVDDGLPEKRDKEHHGRANGAHGDAGWAKADKHTSNYALGVWEKQEYT